MGGFKFFGSAAITLAGTELGHRIRKRPEFVSSTDQAVNAPSIGRLTGGAGTRPRQLAERYSGTVGTGASGWDARAERSMAMAAYAMTTVTTQRISVR